MKTRIWSLAAASVVGMIALASTASPAAASLEFTRDNGSEITFAGTAKVWCAPWANDVSEPALHVSVGEGSRHWVLSAARSDLRKGRRISFPLSFTWDKPRGASLFVADGRNEASTAEEEASGSLLFTRVSCRRGQLVEFRIDATLGSEPSDGDPIKVSGSFRGRVYAAR